MLTNGSLSAGSQRTDNRNSGQGPASCDLRVSSRFEYLLLPAALRTRTTVTWRPCSGWYRGLHDA